MTKQCNYKIVALKAEQQQNCSGSPALKIANNFTLQALSATDKPEVCIGF